jgi:recombination protein U
MTYQKVMQKQHEKNNNYANRGMTLEEDINITNEYYLVNDIAVIYKKPTPIKITKVDYPSRNKAKIKEAFFKLPSTTDYNGVYKGKYIDFEAKQTNSKTSFPLDNIHKHQIEHIRKVINHGGIAFLIIRFCLLNKTFVYMGKDLLNYLEKEKRKSIPLSEFEEKGYEIKIKYNPRIDYLNIIKKYMEV